MNHTFLHMKYTNIEQQESIKRRKTDVEEEAIVDCENDTKIKISSGMIEDYNQEEFNQGNQDITGVHDYGNEMRKDSHLDDYLEGTDELFLDDREKDYECFTP